MKFGIFNKSIFRLSICVTSKSSYIQHGNSLASDMLDLKQNGRFCETNDINFNGRIFRFILETFLCFGNFSLSISNVVNNFCVACCFGICSMIKNDFIKIKINMAEMMGISCKYKKRSKLKFCGGINEEAKEDRK